MLIAQYADGGPSVELGLCFIWDRDTIQPRIMSSSGGPKDTMRNDVHTLFEGFSESDRVVLVRGRGGPGAPLLYLVRQEGRWFDVRGEEVIIRRAPALAGALLQKEAAAG
jgi:hypothetical protein